MAKVTGLGGSFFGARDGVLARLGRVRRARADVEAELPGRRPRRGRHRAAGRGLRVEPDADAYPNGRFAELEDPEGNPIQLWEPNAASLARDAGPGSP